MKKRVVAIICAAAFGMTLTACSGGASSNAPADTAAAGSQAAGSEAQASGGASEAAQTGGETKDTVIFAQGSDVTSLDPHIGKQLRAFAVTCNMFEQLVKLDENMEPQPSLAESWERVSDMEMRFKLRQDVKWHNGEPFTAEDVKYSYERMINTPVVANNIAFLDTVTVEDEYTVVLKTKYPYASLLAAISTPPCSIVPKSVVEKDAEAFALNPVGTGPYKFVEWKPDEYVKLEANPDYWGDKAKTQYLVMKVVPEATQRSIMLETGEIDIAYDISPNEVSRLDGTDGVSVIVGDSMKTLNLNFNASSDGPIGNKLVRQAICHAIDKEGLVEGVLSGIGTPGTLPVPLRAFGYDDTIQDLGYDVEKAKALMKEAGYENGFECSIWVDDDQVYTEVATVLQSMLQEIGIKVNVDVMKQATKQDKLVSHENFDINLSYFNNIVCDADYNLFSNFTKDSKSNFCYYLNQDVEDMIVDSRSEFDDAARKAVYHDIYMVLMDEMPTATLYNEQVCVGISDKVEGFTLNLIGANKYNNVVVYK